MYLFPWDGWNAVMMCPFSSGTQLRQTLVVGTQLGFTIIFLFKVSEDTLLFFVVAQFLSKFVIAQDPADPLSPQ